MGVVCRAEDLKLGRHVALKFLPEDLGSDPHWNASTARRGLPRRSTTRIFGRVYEFVEHEGRPFIGMQFLEGQTLRERLASLAGAMPVEELLDSQLR